MHGRASAKTEIGSAETHGGSGACLPVVELSYLVTSGSANGRELALDRLDVIGSGVYVLGGIQTLIVDRFGTDRHG